MADSGKRPKSETYGSVEGTRGRGQKGHPQNGIVAQGNTWFGLGRLWVGPNGDFKLFFADEVGDNAILALQGNLNVTRTGQFVIEDANGDPIGIKDVNPLPPVQTENRIPDATAKYGGRAQQRQAAAQATGSTPAHAPRRRAPATAAPKSTAAAATPMPSQKVRSVTPRAAKAAGFDASNFTEGDKVRLVSNPDGSSPAPIGALGTVEKVKVKGNLPLGPQVIVFWDGHGASSVFPDQGDIIENAAAKKAS